MKLVDNRAQIEAQFKSVNVTDLTLSGAQRALTYKPAGGDGNSGGNAMEVVVTPPLAITTSLRKSSSPS